MRTSRVFLGLATAALLAMPALAQEQPAINVGRVQVFVPKPGMTKQFEEGRKRHSEWHRKQNDQWTWEVWQVTAGDATGAYLSLSFGHTWKDFDSWGAKFEQADLADSATNMDPYVAGGPSSVWRFMTNLSRPPESKEPPKMAEVIHFIIKPGGASDFMYAIRKIHEAIGKTNWPPRYEWFALVSGGEAPHFVLVLPKNSWAEMAEPEVSFDAMLEKAFGRQEAESLVRTLDKTIQREWSEMLTYRPDLSYRPTTK